jgi:hypothetical protein
MMDWNTLEKETERVHQFSRIHDEIVDKLYEISFDISYEDFDDLRNEISSLLSKLEDYVRWED